MFCNYSRAENILLMEKEVTEMGGMTSLPPLLIVFTVVPLIKMNFIEADII